MDQGQEDEYETRSIYPQWDLKIVYSCVSGGGRSTQGLLTEQNPTLFAHFRTSLLSLQQLLSSDKLAAWFGVLQNMEIDGRYENGEALDS